MTLDKPVERFGGAFGTRLDVLPELSGMLTSLCCEIGFNNLSMPIHDALEKVRRGRII